MAHARALIVEDNTPPADTLCDLLEEAGWEQVGPSATVASALDLIEQTKIDAAILDVRLAGEKSFPVAYALRERGIPLVFLTSSEPYELPQDLGDVVLVEKPFPRALLISTMRRLM